MLQTPQLLSAPKWDLSQGPGSALIFCSAIPLCQWSYWNSGVHQSIFWHPEWSQRRMVCFYWLAKLHWCCWEGGSGHWDIQQIPTVAQINLWLTSTQLGVQEDFSSFPTGTACRKWRNVLLDFRQKIFAANFLFQALDERVSRSETQRSSSGRTEDSAKWPLLLCVTTSWQKTYLK